MVEDALQDTACMAVVRNISYSCLNCDISIVNSIWKKGHLLLRGLPLRSGEAKPRFLWQRLHFSTRTLDRTTSAHAQLCMRYEERISAPRRYYVMLRSRY